MRRLTILLAGCGRIAFEERGAPGDGAGDGPVPTDGPLVCPSSYVAIASGCYRFPTVDEGPGMERGWLDAETACEADGGHLVVFETAGEVAVVSAARTIVSYWVGVSDRITDGTYRWVTGVTAPLPAGFAANEPDPSNAENCIQFDETIGVSDQACDGDLDDWVCEVDGIAVDATTF